MDEQKNENQTEGKVETPKPAGKFLRIKPFALIMILFFTIIVTAGLTIFALTFGEKKVVEVKVPVDRAEFAKLYDAYDILSENYYKDFDVDAVISGAINGLYEGLGDPYSDYMTVEESESFNESLSSSFQGIGAEVQERNGNIIVVSPIKNSPAEKAGILPKDTILSVDGKSIQGMSVNDAVQLIRGEKGTKVVLKLQRAGVAEAFEMTIVRDDIPVETVYGELDKDKIAHIQITTFSGQTANELKKMLEDYKSQGMKGIVLDVRQNPGGYLEAAIEIANLFVEEGKNIVQVDNGSGSPMVDKATAGTKYTLPMTLLVDEGSASASEILAGALRESANVKLVGLNSFGKGTVQDVITQKDGSTIKLTIAKWLTPNGNWIHEKGIAPDVKVDYPSFASLNYVDPGLEFKNGSNDQLVSSAEGMLGALGYNPGTVDTVYDDATENAVKAFQKANNLQVTGVLTGDTTYALMDALSGYMKENDPQLLKAKELVKADM